MKQPQQPIGVTVISPAFAPLGNEAVRRFKEFTGLNVKVIKCANHEGYQMKLRLDELCPAGPVVFFDADLWLVRHTDAFAQPTRHLTAVHDPMVFHPHATAFPARDCETFHLSKSDYFNSGLIMADFSKKEHRAVFRRARTLRRQGKLQPIDKTDQFWLNFARHELGVPWQRLPWGFNFWMRAIEWGCAFMTHPVTAVHAAGIPARSKLSHLRAAAHVFGGEVHPIQEELLRFDHAYRTQLR